ncbi:TonB-dependent receptor [bacterium]|nr:TonB-dependent receptor [bacterium]
MRVYRCFQCQHTHTGNLDGGGGGSAFEGYFGRVSYSFPGKYLLNATIRRDRSSKFAPQNRWGTFGSVGLGWIASEENFFRKIRATISCNYVMPGP